MKHLKLLLTFPLVRKAYTAALLAAAGGIAIALEDGQLAQAEALRVVGLGLAALLATFAVPNDDPKTGRSDPNLSVRGATVGDALLAVVAVIVLVVLLRLLGVV